MARDNFPSDFFTLEASLSPLPLVLFLFGLEDSPVAAVSSAILSVPPAASLFFVLAHLLGFDAA